MHEGVEAGRGELGLPEDLALVQVDGEDSGALPAGLLAVGGHIEGLLVADGRGEDAALDPHLPQGITTVHGEAQHGAGVADVVGGVGGGLHEAHGAGELFGPLHPGQARVHRPDAHALIGLLPGGLDPGDEEAVLGPGQAVDPHALEPELPLGAAAQGVEGVEVAIARHEDPVFIGHGRKGEGLVRAGGHGLVPLHLARQGIGRNQPPTVVVKGEHRGTGQRDAWGIAVGDKRRQGGGQHPLLDQGRQGVGMDRFLEGPGLPRGHGRHGGNRQ